MRYVLTLLLLILPQSLWAACSGVDMRDRLDDSQRAEITERLSGVPFASGNHWRATKDGRTINLIGTMHIDDPRMDALAARLAPVIETADLLMVEATKEDQQALQRDMATNPELAFLQGKTLIELMPEDEWLALAAAAEARGIPAFMAAKFKPWYLSLMLSASPCTIAEVAKGGVGLDMRLMDIATEADVPMQALEHYTTVFSLFDKDPIDEQIDLLTVGILPDEVSENATTTLKEQYFDEAHMAGLETSRVLTRPSVDLPGPEFDKIYDDFIDLLVRVRNEAWMGPIDAAEGDRIVIAAGALHLGGEYGLLNLLEQQGYTLERLPF